MILDKSLSNIFKKLCLLSSFRVCFPLYVGNDNDQLSKSISIFRLFSIDGNTNITLMDEVGNNKKFSHGENDGSFTVTFQ